MWLLGLCLAMAIASSATIWLLLPHYSPRDSGLLVVLSGFLFFALQLRLLGSLARSFPRSCKTVGDLANLALGCNHAKISTQYGKSSEPELFLKSCAPSSRDRFGYREECSRHGGLENPLAQYRLPALEIICGNRLGALLLLARLRLQPNVHRIKRLIFQVLHPVLKRREEA